MERNILYVAGNVIHNIIMKTYLQWNNDRKNVLNIEYPVTLFWAKNEEIDGPEEISERQKIIWPIWKLQFLHSKHYKHSVFYDAMLSEHIKTKHLKKKYRPRHEYTCVYFFCVRACVRACISHKVLMNFIIACGELYSSGLIEKFQIVASTMQCR